MDSLLRQALERREREREEALRTVVLDNRDVHFACRLCGGRCNITAPPQLTVCSKCGGRQKERALVAEMERRAGRVAKCSMGCGAFLRADNISGYCYRCRKAR